MTTLGKDFSFQKRIVQLINTRFWLFYLSSFCMVGTGRNPGMWTPACLNPPAPIEHKFYNSTRNVFQIRKKWIFKQRTMRWYRLQGCTSQFSKAVQNCVKFFSSLIFDFIFIYLLYKILWRCIWIWAVSTQDNFYFFWVRNCYGNDFTARN